MVVIKLIWLSRRMVKRTRKRQRLRRKSLYRITTLSRLMEDRVEIRLLAQWEESQRLVMWWRVRN